MGGTICLLLYTSLLVFYLLRRRRLIFDIPETEFASFCTAGEVLLTGFLLHYLPFFFSDRASLLSRVIGARPLRLLCTGVTLAWLAAVVYVFHKFSVLSYAHTALSANDVRDLRWKDTWDLIIHKK